MTAYHDILDLRIGAWYWDSDDGPSIEERIAEHLTFIGDIDLAEPDYSFHILRLYVRKSDGVILYGTDSGCSCPSPFEDMKVSELKETSLARVADMVREAAPGSDDEVDRWSGYGPAKVLASLDRLMPKLREAGAR
jgi:hypothetical protein